MKALLAAALAIALATAGATAAFAETWKLSTNLPIEGFQFDVLQVFASDVERRTNGAITIDIVPDPSLSDSQIAQKVKKGEVALGSVFLANMAAYGAMFELDSIPYLATTYEQAWKLWGASRAETFAQLRKHGFVLLFAVPWPPQGVFSQYRLSDVSDFRGLRMRVYSATEAALAKQVGATPVVVSMSDINSAFNQGKVDLMITSSETGVEHRAWEFATYFYDLRAFMPKQVVLANEALFDKLDDKSKSALVGAGGTADVHGWQASMFHNIREIERMRAAGLAVSSPSPTLQDGLTRIGVLMAAEWGTRVGSVGTVILDTYLE